MTKSRRAQILMEPQEYRELEIIAEREGVSVAELVRRAVRRCYFPRSEARLDAVREICRANLALPDWQDLEREIADAHASELS